MFATSNVSIRERVALAAGASLLAVLCSCATAPTPQSSPVPETAVISELQVGKEGGATIVSLLGLAEPVYTTFQQDDPARIVVDLSQVRPGAISDAIAVYDGSVEEISVTPFEDSTGQERTRVELSLGTAVSYDVVALEDRLEIRVVPESEFEVASDDPWVASTVAMSQEMDDSTETSETEELVTGNEATASAAGPEATALLDVSADTEGEGVVIELLADGRIGNASQFVLEDPLRLVVDIPELVSKAATAELAVQTGEVARIRVGQHADKVRVVVDGGDESSGFGVAQLVPTATGMKVVIGSDEIAMPEPSPVEEAVEMAAVEPIIEEAVAETASVEPMTEETASVEPMTEETASVEPMTEEAPTVQVYGVQFDAQEDGDRVVILSSAPADYELAQPDPDTVVVRIHGAAIDAAAAVRIAPEQPGPVSLVTAFAQPEAEEAEVRVVINRAPGLDPEVEQQGTMIFLEFPRGNEVAAGLPLLEDNDSVGAGPGELAGDEAAPSSAPAKALAQTGKQAVSEVPAAIDPPGGAVEILREGGLVNGKQYTGRRISLDFKDVEIDDVLRLIAEVSDLNIIAGDEVDGQVTIRLVDVPWDQALDVILLTKGLGFVRVGSVLRIAPSQQLAAEEEARLHERRAKEKLEDLVVKLQPVNYADVGEMAKMCKRLLTARGTVDIDVRTNTIILKDISSVIAEATALIKAIDTQTPQVLIEAKIVEANLDFSREIGSVWAFGAQPLADGFDETSGDRRDLGGHDVRFHDNPLLSSFTDTFNHVSVSNPITSLSNGLLDVGAFLLDGQLNLELRLEAAESSGEGKVISSPRVVTLDNRQARIEQGVSIPFQTFENGDAKLEFIDAVLRLIVTPHITADRSIIMKIAVQRNAPDDSVQTPTGSPAIAKNEAETETLVKDGQTLVIGGIYTIKKADRQSRVPYLSQIPLLGNAFKNTEVRDIRQELLVFVTPRIVFNEEMGV
jgi:type IV pilus assembly protein PilQ